jgi:hypothetical protein
MRIKGDGYGGKLKKTTRTIGENNTVDVVFNISSSEDEEDNLPIYLPKMYADSGGGPSTIAITLF